MGDECWIKIESTSLWTTKACLITQNALLPSSTIWLTDLFQFQTGMMKYVVCLHFLRLYTTAERTVLIDSDS